MFQIEPSRQEKDLYTATGSSLRDTGPDNTRLVGPIKMIENTLFGTHVLD